MTKYPRILIVGTTPYDVNESSRALDTYFHNFPKENLRMIFSKNYLPPKGHCSSMYQITDYDVLQKFLGKTKEVGRVLNYENLQEKPVILEEKLKNYKKKSLFRYYARKALWSKKRWLTSPLESWVNDFKPEAIYICFSDDYFILDITYYFANKYNLPVIAQIGDDYYFKKTDNILLKPYLRKYKKLFDKVMNLDGFGVYISEKLANKYNIHFKLQGVPVYLSTDIDFEEKEVKYEFNYFGKLGLGRYKTLSILGDSLKSINSDYLINVYSSDVSYKKYLAKHNCVLKPAISYEEVKAKLNSGAFNIIASGFSKRDIEQSRYSLSTKVSDLLASSGPIIAIGPKGDGAIDFLSERDCSILITARLIDKNWLKGQIEDRELLNLYKQNAKTLFEQLFRVECNRKVFESNCFRICNKNE